MLVKPLQPENAELPILVPSVITTVFNDDGIYEFWYEEFDAPNIYPKKLLLLLLPPPTNGMVMLVKPLQP